MTHLYTVYAFWFAWLLLTPYVLKCVQTYEYIPKGWLKISCLTRLSHNPCFRGLGIPHSYACIYVSHIPSLSGIISQPVNGKCITVKQRRPLSFSAHNITYLHRLRVECYKCVERKLYRKRKPFLMYHTFVAKYMRSNFEWTRWVRMI